MDKTIYNQLLGILAILLLIGLLMQFLEPPDNNSIRQHELLHNQCIAYMLTQAN